MTFYCGEAKAFETTPLRVSESLANRLRIMPIKFTFPLEKLGTGEYTCQVTVIEPKGRKAAF